MPNKATIDFETRGLISLDKTSAHHYAEHPGTEVLCLAIKIEDQAPQWWAPDFVRSKVSLPRGLSSDELEHFLQSVDVIEAHNAEFEMEIWSEIMEKRHGFKPIPLEKWRCSQAKVLMHGIPAALGKAADALGVPIRKSEEGHKLMMKMCKPQSPTSADLKIFAIRHRMDLKTAKRDFCADALRDRLFSGPLDHELLKWYEDFEGLIRYCLQDVEAEHSVSSRLKDLSPYMQELWRLNYRINKRGIPVDLEAAAAMSKYVQEHTEVLKKQFVDTTEGQVSSTKCTAAFQKWLGSKGVKTDSVDAKHREKLLKQELPADVRKALVLATEANKSSNAKYDAMLRGASFDGRVRGCHIFHKASTGRFAGALIQQHNFPKACFSDSSECLGMIVRGEYDLAKFFYGSPILAASMCLRGTIKASPGHKFICNDFSAIEGRVLAWLAEEESVLKDYADGKCAYCATASRCFEVSYEDLYHAYQKGEQWAIDMRGKGKTGELACGFGGSVGSIFKFAPNMKYRDAKALVKAWRSARPKTQEFWYALHEAAVEAMLQPGTVQRVGKLAYKYDKPYGFLMCRLPSGRVLYYYDPEIKAVRIGPKQLAEQAFEHPNKIYEFNYTDMWVDSQKILHLREPECEELLFTETEMENAPQFWDKNGHALSAMTVVGGKWVRRELRVTILSENVTQAVAADLLFNGMLNADKKGFYLVLDVHDEIMAEEPIDTKLTTADLAAAMCDLPDWAKGLPIDAPGWEGLRYKK